MAILRQISPCDFSLGELAPVVSWFADGSAPKQYVQNRPKRPALNHHDGPVPYLAPLRVNAQNRDEKERVDYQQTSDCKPKSPIAPVGSRLLMVTQKRTPVHIASATHCHGTFAPLLRTIKAKKTAKTTNAIPTYRRKR
jgi:hypothetical protein